MKVSAKVIESYLEKAGVHPSKVYKSKGSVKVRFGYFYRMGQTSKSKAEKVSAALSGSPFQVVGHSDCYNSWPKDSYFEVEVKEA